MEKIKTTANDLARIAAYTQLLSQLCELSPHNESIALENLEQVFKDIAEVCSKSQTELENVLSLQE